MKLIVNARFLTQNITGVQRFAIEISKQLRRMYGEDIRFVSPTNIVHHEIAAQLGAVVVGKRSGHVWEQTELVHYLRANGNPMLLNLANTAPLFYRRKAVTLHDIAFVRFPQTFDWKFRLFYTLLIPQILRHSKVVFTVSAFSKGEIERFYGVDSAKISVIYNGVSPIFFPHLDEKKEPYILAVSSLNAQKNFHSLIKAFNRLSIPDIKLYLVGSMNKSFAALELIEEVEGNPNIVFKGRVEDDELIALYSNALCFVYPSFYEGFGIPPLEAQACGCPVVCSHAASLGEVGGESVVYCDPYSVDDIAHHIRVVLEDESLQQRLRAKGFENIKRFSWEASARKMGKVLEELG
jgi:glycosyltransferase involved in cell wall biosynthesis